MAMPSSGRRSSEQRDPRDQQARHQRVVVPGADSSSNTSGLITASHTARAGSAPSSAREARNEDREQDDPHELDHAQQQHAGHQVRADRRRDQRCHAEERRPIRRGRVAPERRDRVEQARLVELAEDRRRLVIGVQAEVQDRAVGEVAVHVAAEQGRRECQRHTPHGADQQQRARPTARPGARAPWPSPSQAAHSTAIPP